jgi:glycine reductase
VVTCGKIVGFQEGIIDMSGPGALHTPFSRTINLVLEIEVQEDLSRHQHEETVREVGLAAAAYIAETGRSVEPETLETFTDLENTAVSPELPRIAYLYLLLSQGLLHDTYVFNDDAKRLSPCVIAPRQLMDGGIVSGNCVSACDKNTTYHHQNNPIITELYRNHGTTLNFVGVVLSNEPARLAGKEDSAAKAIELVKLLKAQGVVISKEGFGNPDADQMILTRGLEQAGIRVVSITDEYAGPDGLSQSLADATPEADAVISVGNANERLVLPPMARLLGPLEDLSHLAGAYPQSLLADGSLEIELQGIVGSTNELGFQTLSAREV